MVDTKKSRILELVDSLVDIVVTLPIHTLLDYC